MSPIVKELKLKSSKLKILLSTKLLSPLAHINSSIERFNAEFLRNLILLEKFNEAFAFSQSVWNEDELFFESDLLLGLNSFKKKDYKNSVKYFERLNKISQYNLFFDDFIVNLIILSMVKSNQRNSSRF